jgi:glutaminyl-tRNA synthetase
VDPALGERLQLERQGYFFRDPVDSKPDHLVFNRIVPLRDSWAAEAQKQAPAPAPAPLSAAHCSASTTKSVPPMAGVGVK